MSRPSSSTTLVRLFEIAQTLRVRGVKAAELAQRFGVTVRCIYRNLSILEAAGLPLFVDEDHRWRLLQKGGESR